MTRPEDARDFAGVVCWEPAEISDRLIPQEAVYPADEVFAATHLPMRLRKSAFGQGAAVVCDEEELLNDLTAPNITMLLLAITGESGTGKSHLVRWLNTRLKTDRARPAQRIVYIRKYQTSLREIVLAILEGAVGPRFDEVRSKITKVTRELS